MKTCCYWTILICILTISCEKGKKPVGGIRGTVTNEYGQALEGVEVEAGSFSQMTNSYGDFQFDDLPVKEYALSASKPHYLPEVKNITVREDQFSFVDFMLTAGEPFLSLSDSLRKVPSNGGSFELNVESNAAWTVQYSSSWLNTSKENGEGSETVLIHYSENQGEAGRLDSILVEAGTIVQKLYVYQGEAIRLLLAEGRIGNEITDVEDSVYLLFNKPVVVENIINDYFICTCDIEFSMTDNDHGVLFTFSCAEIGGNYPFTVIVSDSDGNQLNESFEVHFYDSRLDFAGYVTDYLLFDEEQEALIAMFNPDIIVRYSLQENAIIQTYDLSGWISPVNIVYNSYNSKVYIMGSQPGAIYIYTEADRPEVFTLDPQTGEVALAFVAEPDSLDHPQYPSNIPYDMGFTQSGLGVVTLKSNTSSELRWKMIDCTQNDSLYIYPYYNSTINELTDFDAAYANYDATKLYLSKPSGTDDFGIFESSTQQISILAPGSITKNVFITPYRKGDIFYAGNLYHQFIIDPAGNMSPVTNLDNRHGGSADFSYLEVPDPIVYFFEEISFFAIPNSFWVLDYNSGSKLLKCDLLDGFVQFKTTIDGEYGLAIMHYSDATSSLYRFRTESFRQY